MADSSYMATKNIMMRILMRSKLCRTVTMKMVKAAAEGQVLREWAITDNLVLRKKK